MNDHAARMERRLEIPLLIAALLTVPAIALDQSPPSTTWGAIATALNWGIWLAFLGEVALMLSVVDNRMRWLRDHPLDIAIVLLTPPFLPASLQAARAFRLLRVLRLLRAATLLRRLLTTEGVRDAAVLALLTILGGGAGFAAVEKVDQHGHHLNAWDGVWWAVTTVTTVGYGDLAPSTTGGRVIAIVVMLVGIGFVAILTAAAAERFIRTRERSERERAELLARLDDIVARLDTAERRGQ